MIREISIEWTPSGWTAHCLHKSGSTIVFTLQALPDSPDEDILADLWWRLKEAGYTLSPALQIHIFG